MSQPSKSSLKAIQQVQHKVDLLRKELNKLEDRKEQVEAESNYLKREIKQYEKDREAIMSQNEKMDRQIQQIQQQQDDLKVDEKVHRQSTQQDADQSKKDHSHLQIENRKLLKDRNEMLQAVKKQGKLLDLLKK